MDEEMTLRDIFAIHGAAALMNNPAWVEHLDTNAAANGIEFKRALAQQAYVLADFMLIERERGKDA